MKEYNPYWPFPQFDEDGKQMLPADWNKRQPKPKVDLDQFEEAPL